MDTFKFESKFLIPLSEPEMQNCYGGSWLKDLLQWIGDSYVEIKKGIIDGWKAI